VEENIGEGDGKVEDDLERNGKGSSRMCGTVTQYMILVVFQ